MGRMGNRHARFRRSCAGHARGGLQRTLRGGSGHVPSLRTDWGTALQSRKVAPAARGIPESSPQRRVTRTCERRPGALPAAILAVVLGHASARCECSQLHRATPETWEHRVLRQVSNLEVLYEQWCRARQAVEARPGQCTSPGKAATDSQRRPPGETVFRQYLLVLQGIYDLWKMSGHCEFRDIPERDIVRRAPEVAARYRRLVARYEDVPVEKIQREGLQGNIEMLKTDYCCPALDAIQAQVKFSPTLKLSGVTRCIKIADRRKEMMYREMLAWLKQNSPALLWNTSCRHFTGRNSPEGFRFPDGLLEAWRSSETLPSQPATLPGTYRGSERGRT
jgi:hypothetical protein